MNRTKIRTKQYEYKTLSKALLPPSRRHKKVFFSSCYSKSKKVYSPSSFLFAVEFNWPWIQKEELRRKGRTSFAFHLLEKTKWEMRSWVCASLDKDITLGSPEKTHINCSKCRRENWPILQGLFPMLYSRWIPRELRVGNLLCVLRGRVECG